MDAEVASDMEETSLTVRRQVPRSKNLYLLESDHQKILAHTSFEGVCLTHVILAPGACWGGSEQRLLTPDPADPLDPVDPADPRMSSRFRILGMFYST